METQGLPQPVSRLPKRNALYQGLAVIAVAVAIFGVTQLPGSESANPGSPDAEPPALLVQTS